VGAAAANAQHLRERFVQRLLALQPRSVLDVGCGAGAVLGLCRAAGVPALGIEADPAVLRAPRAAGLRVVQARAQALPCADRAFDWVVLRHVAHHLRDVGEALEEAARVCARGLLLAEPWYDETIPSQELAARADRWAKAQDRRHGRVHDENLGPRELLALLPAAWRERAEVERYVCLRAQSWQEFRAENADLFEGLAEDDEALAQARALEADCRGRGMTVNGTVIVTVWRP
jgi:SAM-dependent methyltransferase